MLVQFGYCMSPTCLCVKVIASKVPQLGAGGIFERQTLPGDLQIIERMLFKSIMPL